MQFKLVPPAPDDLGVVADAQRAVPLVPDSEDDCCERLIRRVGFPSRDAARTWLTFLRALELATETPGGFKRLRNDPTPDHLRDAFVRRVFTAEELLAVLDDAGEPVSADEAYDRVRDRVPQWEHFKNPNRWEEIWRERVGDVLEWFVLLDLAERREDGYVRS
ncbi:hypothetical protein [Haloprofundus sp. MHR1]|uniref:hypothetical protein n=1 Tax=Haloprofundus sp. MHR1 TaxID=2572921 RepID=UPI0010BE3484|nr:hypothetical protein [Haloprofundus sp. MHR1]QCJ46142.1 hypothetical protein FCF25_02975 [Haloprofundus sp. MHR1]